MVALDFIQTIKSSLREKEEEGEDDDRYSSSVRLHVSDSSRFCCNLDFDVS
jgi:hypothetical protein